jgi:hypothetical protein
MAPGLAMETLGVLGGDGLNGVRDVVTFVNDILDELVQFFPVDIANRVDLARLQLRPQMCQPEVE